MGGLVAICLILAMAYSCKQTNETMLKAFETCVNAGGTWIQQGGGDSPRPVCIKKEKE